MKYWKCPHCGRVEKSENDIVMVICPACLDCNMVEDPLPKQELTSEVPSKKVEFVNKEQICMRCYKVPAEDGELFCKNCIMEREKLDELIKNRSKEVEKDEN